MMMKRFIHTVCSFRRIAFVAAMVAAASLTALSVRVKADPPPQRSISCAIDADVHGRRALDASGWDQYGEGEGMVFYQKSGPMKPLENQCEALGGTATVLLTIF